jgi:hypothetical protein
MSVTTILIGAAIWIIVGSILGAVIGTAIDRMGK